MTTDLKSTILRLSEGNGIQYCETHKRRRTTAPIVSLHFVNNSRILSSNVTTCNTFSSSKSFILQRFLQNMENGNSEQRHCQYFRLGSDYPVSTSSPLWLQSAWSIQMISGTSASGKAKNGRGNSE